MYNDNTEEHIMSSQAFAVLGGGKIAYVKEIDSEHVHEATTRCGLVEVVSLVSRFGRERAMSDTLACIEAVARDLLEARVPT